MVIESVSYTGKIRQPLEEPIASTEYHERSMMVSIRTRHAPFISIRAPPAPFQQPFHPRLVEVAKLDPIAEPERIQVDSLMVRA